MEYGWLNGVGAKEIFLWCTVLRIYFWQPWAIFLRWPSVTGPCQRFVPGGDHRETVAGPGDWRQWEPNMLSTTDLHRPTSSTAET